MDGIWKFIGGFLEQVAEGFGGIGWAVCIFSAVAALFLGISTAGEIRSLQLADKIRELHEQIVEKYHKNSEQMAKELIGMHKTFGYHTFLGFLSYPVHALLIVLLAGVFSRPEAYLAAAWSQGSHGFMWIRDLSVSPLGLLLSGRIAPEFLVSLGTLLLADLLVSWNIRITVRKSLMPVGPFCHCTVAAFLLVSFLAPQAVLLYVLLFFGIKDIQLLVTLRFFPYRFNRQQELYYQNCLRAVKKGQALKKG